jgi:hypothetical protein
MVTVGIKRSFYSRVTIHIRMNSNIRTSSVARLPRVCLRVHGVESRGDNDADSSPRVRDITEKVWVRMAVPFFRLCRNEQGSIRDINVACTLEARCMAHT